jgi:hypothetical protein
MMVFMTLYKHIYYNNPGSTASTPSTTVIHDRAILIYWL